MILAMTGNFGVDVLSFASNMLPTLVENIAVSHDIVKKQRKERKNALKRAEKIGRSVSDTLLNDINTISYNNDLVEIDLISTAIRTNKWINYAIYYMTEETNLLKCGIHERELLNSISELAGFGKMYQSAGSANLMDFDIRNSDRKIGSRFILLFNEVLERVQDPDFISKMKLRKAKMHNTILGIGVNNSYSGNHTIDQEGYIHPVFFSNNPIITDIGSKKGEGIDQPTFERLEKVFSNLISDSKYSYSRNQNGLINLTIEKNNSFGATEQYLIDDGTLLGGSTISILGQYETINGSIDKVFVDVAKHPDIAFNILKSIFYRMTVEEVNTASSDLLANGFIYTYIDFSNTGWFDYLSFTDKATLGSHLINIVKSMGQDPNLAYPPRLRFTQYKDPDNFTLVSDRNVVSPLADTMETTPNILEGLSFIVQDGEISEFFGGQPIQPILNQPLVNQYINSGSGIIV